MYSGFYNFLQEKTAFTISHSVYPKEIVQIIITYLPLIHFSIHYVCIPLFNFAAPAFFFAF